MSISAYARKYAYYLGAVIGILFLTLAGMVSGSISGISKANAASAATWPLVITQISPAPAENSKNSFNYEYFELYNTTDKPIDLVKAGYSLAYTSNTSDPSSPLADYPLRYQSSSIVVSAHSPLVVWVRDSATNPALTEADFRKFWDGVDHAAGIDSVSYSLAEVDGTNGLANAGNRGIRITDISGTNVNYAFYPAVKANESVYFQTPTETTSKEMDVYKLGTAHPGAVDNAQLTDRPSTASPAPSNTWHIAEPADASNLDGLIDTATIDKKFEEMRLMGTVLMAKNGAVTTRSYGDANHSAGIPNTADTLYATASLQKAMTASLIMQLIHEGKLTFDTKLTDYFNVAPFNTAATPITVRMLLEHTSGIRMPEMPVFTNPYDHTSPQLILTTQDEQVQHAIDTITIQGQGSFSYSNGNYTMLAALASKVTGEPYEQLMEDRVFKPAGMNHTYFWDTVPDSEINNIAQEYKRSTGGTDYATDGGPVATRSLLSTLLGAGNLYSTVGDYYKFNLALQNGQVLTADEYKEISDNQLAVNGYAGGLYHYPGYTKRARGSNGTDEASGRYNSYIYASENNNNFVVIFSNQSYAAGLKAPEDSYDHIAEYIYDQLRTDPVLSSVENPILNTKVKVSPQLPQKVTVGFSGATTTDVPAAVGATFSDAFSSSNESQTVSTAPISVIWNPVSPNEYARAGTFLVHGSLVGLHQSVTASVTVTDSSATSGTGDLPNSPETSALPSSVPSNTESTLPSPKSSLMASNSVRKHAKELALTGQSLGFVELGALLLILGVGIVAGTRRTGHRHS